MKLLIIDSRTGNPFRVYHHPKQVDVTGNIVTTFNEDGTILERFVVVQDVVMFEKCDDYGKKEIISRITVNRDQKLPREETH